MTVTMYSNFLNHHQLPFCKAMQKLTGNGFTFVATEPFNQAVVSAGYKDMNMQYDFCLPSYLSSENYKESLRLCTQSDVVILGSAPEIYIRKRFKHTNLLTFRYSERLFRPIWGNPKDPQFMFPLFRNNTWYTSVLKKRFYLLCASAYTASDFSKVGAFQKRAYKWGYFPQYLQRTCENVMSKKQNPTPKILWVGRMLELKHGELAIQLAAELKKKDILFSMQMIGDGPMFKKWVTLAKELGLNDLVTFSGVLPSEDVQKEMLNADIFLFTSDVNEGWGAVLNEAMSCGCAVIASKAAGSTLFLLSHLHNGIIVDLEKDINSFFTYGEKLCTEPSLATNLGTQARLTIETTWNAQRGAERFMGLVEHLKTHKDGSPFADGPCSLSEVEDL